MAVLDHVVVNAGVKKVSYPCSFNRCGGVYAGGDDGGGGSVQVQHLHECHCPVVAFDSAGFEFVQQQFVLAVAQSGDRVGLC